MTAENVNHIKAAGAAAPWDELAGVERRLAELVSQRPDATVRELAQELAELEEALAETRGRIEAIARHGQRTAQLERVVDALLPAEVPSAAGVWHAQRSAASRLELVREWGAWSAAEVADRAGSSAGNRSALASAWRAAGRALAVEWHGRTLFPPLQFGAGGQTRPGIGAALAFLRRTRLSDWQAAVVVPR